MNFGSRWRESSRWVFLIFSQLSDCLLLTSFSWKWSLFRLSSNSSKSESNLAVVFESSLECVEPDCDPNDDDDFQLSSIPRRKPLFFILSMLLVELN